MRHGDFLRAHFVAAALCALAFGSVGALAKDKSQWADVSQDVRDWYRNAKLTPAARKRLQFENCCDHADVVKTEFRVNKTDANDEWWWVDQGAWRRIPDDIIHHGESAPGGKPTLFVYSGKETCFYPGTGGI